MPRIFLIHSFALRDALVLALLGVAIATPGDATQACRIETIAGGGRSFSGDGGPALDAEFDGLTDAVAASDGSIYAADSRNSRIRRITPDGIVSTLAGPEQGLMKPTRLALSPDGAVLAYDGGARRIWRVSAAGVVAPLLDLRLRRTAHLGEDLGLAASADGAVYIASPETNRVWLLDAGGRLTPFAGTGAAGTPESNGDGGPAVMATLNEPRDVDVGPDGLVYIVETGDSRVRRVDDQGQIQTNLNFAEPGIPGLVVRDGGAFASGLLGWLREALPSRPTRIAAGTGFVDVLLEDGPLFGLRWDIFVPGLALPPGPTAPSQSLRVDDFGRSLSPGAVVRRFYDDGSSRTLTGAGSRPPTSVANLPDGRALFTDPEDRIWRAANAERGQSPPSIEPPWGEPAAPIDDHVAGRGALGSAGDGGPASQARLFSPREAVARKSGEIFIADETRVRWIDRSGVIRTLPGDFANAHLAVDPKDNVYIATDQEIFKMRASGLMERIATFERCESPESDCGDGGSLQHATFLGFGPIASGSDGTIYMLESGRLFPGLLPSSSPLTPEKEQLVILGFGGNNRLRTISPNGVVGTALPREQIFSADSTIGPDAAGGVLLSSSFQSSLWRINGALRRAVGGSIGYVDSPFHQSPSGLVGGADGTIYFSRDNTVRRLRPAGVINTIAGRIGRAGYSGDGGLATEALLTEPESMALNAQGDLLIADPAAGVVRIVRDPAACDPVVRPQIRLDGIRKTSGSSGGGGFAVGLLGWMGQPIPPPTFAPGSMISIFGARLGPTPAAEVDSASLDRLPTQIDGVSVEIDGLSAPLLLASGGQVNAVVPAETTRSGQAFVQVTVDGVSSDEAIIEMRPSAPGVLAVLNADGSANTLSNNQSSHHEITVLVSGLGLAGVDPGRIAKQSRTIPAEGLRIESIADGPAVDDFVVATVPDAPESLLAIRFSYPLPVPAPLVGRSFELRVGDGPATIFTVYVFSSVF